MQNLLNQNLTIEIYKIDKIEPKKIGECHLLMKNVFMNENVLLSIYIEIISFKYYK